MNLVPTTVTTKIFKIASNSADIVCKFFVYTTPQRKREEINFNVILNTIHIHIIEKVVLKKIDVYVLR